MINGVAPPELSPQPRGFSQNSFPAKALASAAQAQNEKKTVGMFLDCVSLQRASPKKGWTFQLQIASFALMPSRLLWPMFKHEAELVKRTAVSLRSLNVQIGLLLCLQHRSWSSMRLLARLIPESERLTHLRRWHHKQAVSGLLHLYC